MAVGAHCPTGLPGLPTTAPTTSMSFCRIGWPSTTKSFLARSSSLANWSLSAAGLGRCLPPQQLDKRTPHHRRSLGEVSRRILRQKKPPLGGEFKRSQPCFCCVRPTHL